ncbi:MAG: AAA family ATPase [Clostridia bacterium]|nr:AAA family ATPase [Clostridia bacterium]
MYIEKLHISAFGPLCDVEVELGEGLNIIEGANESGKSALAAFIKFIFYGLSSRASGEVSERQKYVNWARGYAAGFAVCSISDGSDTKRVRIERTLNAKTGSDGKTKYSERVRVLDHETSMPISVNGQPGDVFFGVPEGVFAGSAYAAQEASVKPDGGALKDALENIVSAADENINIKKASELLDKARVKLLYKKGNGGEIWELEKREAALEAKLAESRTESAGLIKAEVSLADVKENIESAKKRGAELEDISEAIDVLDAESRLLNARELEKRYGEAQKELEEISSGAIDDKFLSSLAGAVRDIERAETQKAELDGDADTTPARDPDDRIFADAASARRLGKLARGMFSAGAAVLILGLAGVILTAFFKFVGENDGFIVPLVLSVFVVLGGVGVMVFSHVFREKYYDILDAWDAEDEDDLERMAGGVGSSMEESAERRATLAAIEKNVKEARETLDTLAEHIGINAASYETQKLIKYLAKVGRDTLQKRRALESETSKLKGQLEAVGGQLTPERADEIISRAAEIRETEAGREALAMNDSERASVSREATFIRTKLDNLRGRELDLERECAALRATVTSPAKLSEELEDVRRSLKLQRANHDALILAAETLETAGENIRSSVVPKLGREASGIVSEVTDGRYGELGITGSFEMNFRNGDFGTLELDYLSAGTKDIAYLALRVALVKALYDSVQRPPVIFDESLAFLDEDRVKKALGVLENTGVQTLLLTCRSLEGSVTEKGTRISLARA